MRIARIVRIVVLLIVAALQCSSATAADPNPAMSQPDQFAWTLFVQVTKPAISAGNNNVLFETWASDLDTFHLPPIWPGAAPTPLRLNKPALRRLAKQPAKAGKGVHLLVVPTSQNDGEEIRRNKVTHDFIVQNNLHTVDGLKAWFAAGGAKITFPVDSIEVKANWVSAVNLDPNRYHINRASDGKDYALVAMHIISKAVPNWTWATFEQEDNLGRCDVIGCRDSFGATISYVPSQSTPGGKYPSCQKTPALLAMFAQGGISPVFAHYCLKGTQTDFTDPTGVPTLLGNSVTEKGFVNTASCLTCHARAAFDFKGESPYTPGFIRKPSLCPTGDPCSPNGTPKIVWFWTAGGGPNRMPVTVQTDFVWSIPICAVKPGQTTAACQ